MKKPSPDYDPDDEGRGSSGRGNAENDRLNRRMTIVFGCIILGAILITIIALAFSK
jgi:hypothetical protein